MTGKESTRGERSAYACLCRNVPELLLTASGAMNRPVTVATDMLPDGLTLSS